MSPADAAADAVEDAADLYGLEPASFTPARNALAKRLRASGEKAEAAVVAKLRRPPITAWALNQVARGDATLVAALGQAGDDLAAAMERALGGDASGVRDAQRQERDAVEAVLDAAAVHLEAAGHRPTEQARQRMAQTLRASLVDDDARDKLARGVLDADVDAVGFGRDDLSGFIPAAAGAGTSPARAAEPAPVPPHHPGDRDRADHGPTDQDPTDQDPTDQDAASPGSERQEPDPAVVQRAAAARDRQDELTRVAARARELLQARRAEVDERRAQHAAARRQLEEAESLLHEAEEAAVAAERQDDEAQRAQRAGAEELEAAERALAADVRP